MTDYNSNCFARAVGCFNPIGYGEQTRKAFFEGVAAALDRVYVLEQLAVSESICDELGIAQDDQVRADEEYARDCRSEWRAEGWQG